MLEELLLKMVVRKTTAVQVKRKQGKRGHEQI